MDNDEKATATEVELSDFIRHRDIYRYFVSR